MHHPRHWPQGVPALLYNLPQSSSLPICHFPLCREWQEGPGASTTPFLNLLPSFSLGRNFSGSWIFQSKQIYFLYATKHPSSCPLCPVQLIGKSLPQMTGGVFLQRCSPTVMLRPCCTSIPYCSFPSVAWKDLPHFFPFL